MTMPETPPPAAPPAAAPAPVPAPAASETLTALSGRLREETTRREVAEARAAQAVRAEQTVTVYNAIGRVDAELAAEITSKHAALPAEGRPELGAWAAGLVAAPPKWMQGYLPAAPAAAPVPAPVVPAPAPVPPTVGAGGAVPALGGGAGAQPAASATAIAVARADAKRTGDWSKVTALLQQAAKSS